MGAGAGSNKPVNSDGYWWSNDGLRLHYRDYGGAQGACNGRPPILCLPGLTRNARDFEGFATRLSPAWRVLAIDLRGRGESGFAKDPMTYVPLTYTQDLERLLLTLEIDRFVIVGTSLGGIVAMLLAATHQGRIAGAVLNDVGPEIEASGLKRLRGLVGRAASWPTWLHAAHAGGQRWCDLSQLCTERLARHGQAALPSNSGGTHRARL